jgi:hypothetical protein
MCRRWRRRLNIYVAIFTDLEAQRLRISALFLGDTVGVLKRLLHRRAGHHRINRRARNGGAPIEAIIKRRCFRAGLGHQLIGDLMGIRYRPEIALNMPRYTISKSRLTGLKRIPNDGSPDTRGTG